ncbi:hypothetical protein Lsan_3248 [Legionella santicrucis]|uniref:Uncharacterized protein n=1 Tax=Legionella santicrucis TaxID=45074 RepID=A0A0W0YFS4_9GAMM|nr:hypothetical protein [Legionella santicrucis]KTD55696.1 hypothetical protein Lsan_3248 [Legionella santicrucis]
MEELKKEMLQNLIVSVEILIKEEIKSHPILKGPASSASKILNVINEFKTLNAEEQDNIEKLNRVVAKIERLALASQRNRDNPLARFLMADSSGVYDDIVNSIAAIKMNKLLQDSVSSPEVQQENWIELSSQGRSESPKESMSEEISESDLLISSSLPLPSSRPDPELKREEQKLSFSAKTYDDEIWERPIRRRKARSPQQETIDLNDLSISSSIPSSQQSPELKEISSPASSSSSSSSQPDPGLRRPRLQRADRAIFRQSVIRPLININAEDQGKAVEKQEAPQASSPSFTFVSEATNQQIIKVINTNYAPNLKGNFESISSQSSQEMLSSLEQNLRICERLKHPYPTWVYTRIEPEQPGEKAIIKIKHDPTTSITHKELDTKIKYSIITRKLSIIGGVLTLLDSPDYLTSNPEQKQAIRNELARLSNEIIASRNNAVTPDPKEELDRFVVSLATSLKTMTNPVPNNIIRDIREAERYFVAEHNKNQVLIVETPRENETILQIDIGLNHQLTPEQKQEYLAIHNNEDKQPKWFQALSAAEQSWYLERIPHPNNPEAVKEEKWNNFQLLFKSSAMPHAPGFPNARINYLMLKRNEGLEVVSASVKSATPVSYEMPSEEQEKHSKDNAQQLVNITQHLASINHENLWGNFFRDNKPKIPILIQSLLSEKVEKMGFEVAKADNRLIQGQVKAMKDLDAEGFHLMYHNDGTNAFSRGNKISMRDDPEFEELVNIADEFLAAVYHELDQRINEKSEHANSALEVEGGYLFCVEKGKAVEQQTRLNKFIERLEGNPHITSEQKASIIIMIRVLDEYHRDPQEDPKLSRNKAEYIIALKKLLVEAMGGAASNNCKSGKDRTGQSEVYQHALTLFTMLHSESDALLSYDEKGDRRNSFCQLAAMLNASQKIQEAAAFNTPGCVGTKSNGISKIIDDGIRQEGQFKELHSKGCKLASMNKPKEFIKDESSKAMEAQKMTNKTTNAKNRLNDIKGLANKKAQNSGYEDITSESRRDMSMSR